jgi:ABC-type phosphate transport system substrate-binding protein
MNLQLLTWLAVTVGRSTHARDAVLSLHGSGTTNPSFCYWNVMGELMTRSKVPLRLTYRAVGSTTGQEEFINSDNIKTPAADFGSGDIPLSTTQFQALAAASIDILHFPVLVGAVAIFHSVPTLDSAPLNMTGCLLARIYTNDVLDWSDPDIVALNPNMELPKGGSLPIAVARRIKGSSSTAAVTEVC